jgi:hypothetical protein
MLLIIIIIEIMYVCTTQIRRRKAARYGQLLKACRVLGASYVMTVKILS